ncbi:transcriptional regulator [Nitrosopumilus sp.]|uniref:transcriptional regulator n=1 Tax=Nitrosopumilus sp. TaxID=2024843 RepID=UPI003B5AF7A0
MTKSKSIHDISGIDIKIRGLDEIFDSYTSEKQLRKKLISRNPGLSNKGAYNIIKKLEDSGLLEKIVFREYHMNAKKTKAIITIHYCLNRQFTKFFKGVMISIQEKQDAINKMKSKGAIEILKALEKEKCMTVKKLSETTKKSRNNLGNMIYRLRTEGILECKHFDKNNRCTSYQLTKHGRKALENVSRMKHDKK